LKENIPSHLLNHLVSHVLSYVDVYLLPDPSQVEMSLKAPSLKRIKKQEELAQLQPGANTS
jgi:hypothetical protein